MSQYEDTSSFQVARGGPGFDPRRLLRLMRHTIADCRLNLERRYVVTEAATGAYVVTPVLAALAGASHVYAVAQSTRHGTVEQVREQTMSLARLAGVADKIEISEEKDPEHLARADIVTNSGHLRPITASDIASMKHSAVLPLMFEAWEIDARPSDVDLAALRRHGLATAGTNERHPAVDVFAYLPSMAVRQLLDAGLSVYRSRLLLLCDNAFADSMVRGLRGAGADVHLLESCQALAECGIEFSPDALIVALTPTGEAVVDAETARMIGERWPGCFVAQFWGDIDRLCLRRSGVPFWPVTAPPAGHMAVLPSDIGPDPIVRLQTGGLKVAEVLLKPVDQRTSWEMEFLDEL